MGLVLLVLLVMYNFTEASLLNGLLWFAVLTVAVDVGVSNRAEDQAFKERRGREVWSKRGLPADGHGTVRHRAYVLE